MYVIYIHCWHDKARVHHIACKHYRQRNPLGNARGVWTEPILDFGRAMAQAKQIGKSDVAACRVCCKRKG